MRRVNVNGDTSLMDYCTAGPQYASGGFIADSAFTGARRQRLPAAVPGPQQLADGWSNGVWNQVFAGTAGAPPHELR